MAGIPETWLSETAKAWPESDGYESPYPVLNYGDACLFGDALPAFAGSSAELTASGYGPLEDREDSYVYTCSMSGESYAGSLTLYQFGDLATAESYVDSFVSQPSSEVQDNEVTEVTSGRLTMPVLTRWYPTNPQGMYQAVYFDEDALAFFSFEINSLDAAEFDELEPQAMADQVVAILAAARE